MFSDENLCPPIVNKNTTLLRSRYRVHNEGWRQCLDYEVRRSWSPLFTIKQLSTQVYEFAYIEVMPTFKNMQIFTWKHIYMRYVLLIFMYLLQNQSMSKNDQFDIRTTKCMHGLTIDHFAVLWVSGCFN